MFRTDNPVADAERHIAEQDAALQKLPRCSECDKRIQDEYCFEINGELICYDCMDNNHRKAVEYYVE
jgi:formylmethanofuran dehydrogenase subunit E